MARSPASRTGQGQPGLSPLGVQFFSSLEALEITSSADRQLIRGHNLVGAVRLQFVRPSFFDDGAGEHGELLDEVDGIDVPLSMHVYPFPETEEWESRWFFFDVQFHPYQLHFRRRVEDGAELVVGTWEDSYAKLAQVRGQMCVQPIAVRPLRLADGIFPTIAPRASFYGPIDMTTFHFRAGSLSSNQLKCCGFVQCSTYLVPPRDGDPTFKGGQMFHILVYMPHDQQPWKSRIDWMKSSPEGGFTSRKWMYGRGSIVGGLNPALLEEELQVGQYILVVLADEFGFTANANWGNDETPSAAARLVRHLNALGILHPADRRMRDQQRRWTTNTSLSTRGLHRNSQITGWDCSFEEMRQELFEFVETQGYRIRIRRSVQKVSKVTGEPLEKRRFVWECDRAGRTTEARKSGCPFSFSAVEIQIGTDRWEIKYTQKKSQHIHNHGPRDGPVTRPRRGEQTLQNEDKGLARLDPISL